MRTLSATSLLIILICTFAPSLAIAVSEEEITAQAALVASEAARLDSLVCTAAADIYRAVADSDSVLTAAGVTVCACRPDPATAIRDTAYVDIDVPYTQWATLTQRQWQLKMMETPWSWLPREAIGLYGVPRLQAERALGVVRDFLDENLLPQQE